MMAFNIRLICLAVCVASVYCINSYKICAVKESMQDCQDMVNTATQINVDLDCVEGNDKAGCLSLVLQRQADVVAVEPDDMYHAAHIPNQDFLVIQEYRTDEDLSAKFRYRAVMVIKNSLGINSLSGLRGKKSCHTGVNRNVGYRIPLTLLAQHGVLASINDSSLSPIENELRALSQTFTKSCIVGKWSPDADTNRELKNRYSNLCALCEHPSICNYPDNFSGYDGALRCLARNGGDVAFTKEKFVNKFFGAGGEESPDGYRYFCEDGSRQEIAGNKEPCSWAARPWPGLLAHTDVLINLEPLREKTYQLAVLGYNQNKTWASSVLGMSPSLHHMVNNSPISPAVYLSNANYFNVVDREHKANVTQG